ncbi:MAG: C-terminal target protein [Cytophagaceae bacterium]|nr:C-terminal target protein [Cytophagaceae bacterium]
MISSSTFRKWGRRCCCSIGLVSALSLTGRAQGVNHPPLVSIRNLNFQTEYLEPASISLQADAYDIDGVVTKVEFYLCNTELAELEYKPYKIMLSDLPAGHYCITAIATDNSHATTESFPVGIKVVSADTSCENTASYVENGGYNPGSRVLNGDRKYKCKPFPYSGWCNGASWAYAPGTGSNWQDAWIDLGTCDAETGLSCVNTPAYVENGGYAPESQVVNLGILYECKPWPYSGWCNGASWAYEPGVGSNWQDAWVERGACSEFAWYNKSAARIIAHPHPFEDHTTVRLEGEEHIVSYVLYNSNGVTLLAGSNLDEKDIKLGDQLASGYYILHVTTKNATYTQTIIKR